MNRVSIPTVIAVENELKRQGLFVRPHIQPRFYHLTLPNGLPLGKAIGVDFTSDGAVVVEIQAYTEQPAAELLFKLTAACTKARIPLLEQKLKYGHSINIKNSILSNATTLEREMLLIQSQVTGEWR